MYLTCGKCPINSNNSSNCCYSCDDDDDDGGDGDGRSGNDIDKTHPKDYYSHVGASWVFRGKSKLLARILCNCPTRTGSIQDVNVEVSGHSIMNFCVLALSP